MLVRRVKQGKTWHPATDDLKGTHAYGTYGTPSSDSTFSIAWQGLGTELLLTTGAFDGVVLTHFSSSFFNPSFLFVCSSRRSKLVDDD